MVKSNHRGHQDQTPHEVVEVDNVLVEELFVFRVEYVQVRLGQETELDVISFLLENVEQNMADRYQHQTGLAAYLQ